MATAPSPPDPGGTDDWWSRRQREIQEREEHRRYLKRELRAGRFPNIPTNERAELEREIADEDTRAQMQAAADALNPLSGVLYPGDVAAEKSDGRPWAIDGVYVDGAKGLIAAKVKQGKSTLVTEIAVSLSTGTPLFGLPEFPVRVEPAPVLMLQSEDDSMRVDRDMEKILAARGLGPQEHQVARRDRVELNVLQEDHYNALRQLVGQRGFRYVILNPIHQMVGEVNMTTWDNGPEIVRRLNQLQEVGATPIITIPVKQNARWGLESILAPTVFGGWYESSVLIKSQLRGDYRDFVFRADSTRDRDLDGERTIRLRGTGVGRWEYPPQAAQVEDDDDTEQPSNPQRYRAFMEANPDATDEEAATAVGVSTRQIRRYKEGGR